MTSPKPDWRDPAMPIKRNYRTADGRTIEYVTPEFETALRQQFFDASNPPLWRDDPTYNLNRKKK